MRLLLDTHAILWAMIQPELFNAEARAAIETRRNECWISPVSAWEMSLLARKGRMTLGAPVREWLLRAQLQMDLQEAPLSLEVALAAGEMEFDHADPADHLLAATAKVMGMTLVTADRRLLGRTDITALAAHQR